MPCLLVLLLDHPLLPDCPVLGRHQRDPCSASLLSRRLNAKLLAPGLLTLQVQVRLHVLDQALQELVGLLQGMHFRLEALNFEAVRS